MSSHYKRKLSLKNKHSTLHWVEKKLKGARHTCTTSAVLETIFLSYRAVISVYFISYLIIRCSVAQYGH